MATSRDAKARKAPCAQEGLCSLWNECPYDHVVQRCFNASMDDLELEDETLQGWES